jgi:hypothetical protein
MQAMRFEYMIGFSLFILVEERPDATQMYGAVSESVVIAGRTDADTVRRDLMNDYEDRAGI